MRRAIVPASLLLAGVLVPLLLAEIVLRAIDFSRPSFYTWDENIGVTLRPFAEGWFTREGRAYVRISSQGLRDEEHSETKPPGVVRVAILGDSFSEAMQVDQQHAFWAVAEQRLGSCPHLQGRQPEFINFGVSRFGTAQSLLMLRHRAWRFQPDIVVLAFYPGNDVSDNARRINQVASVPYFDLVDGVPVLDESYRAMAPFPRRDSALGGLYGWLLDHSRVIQIAEYVRYLSRQPQRGIDPRSQIYREPDDADWREGWRLTEELIALMHREVAASGAQMMVMMVTNPLQVHPDAETRQRAQERLGVEDLLYPNQRIGALGQRLGLPVLNLVPRIRDEAERTGQFLHFNDDSGGGHWNEHGHRLAGEQLADALCRDIVPLRRPG